MPQILELNNFRDHLAQGILEDAESKSMGRATRLERWGLRFSVAALAVGFFLAQNAHTHMTGWVVFLGVMGALVGVFIAPAFPAVQQLQYRLSRSGLQAAYEMKLPDLLAAWWAINHQSRPARQ